MNLFTLSLLVAISLVLILGVAAGWSLLLTGCSLALCFVAIAGYKSLGGSQ